MHSSKPSDSSRALSAAGSSAVIPTWFIALRPSAVNGRASGQVAGRASAAAPPAPRPTGRIRRCGPTPRASRSTCPRRTRRVRHVERSCPVNGHPCVNGGLQVRCVEPDVVDRSRHKGAVTGLPPERSLAIGRPMSVRGRGRSCRGSHRSQLDGTRGVRRQRRLASLNCDRPATAISPEEADARFGFIGQLVDLHRPASSAITREAAWVEADRPDPHRSIGTTTHKRGSSGPSLGAHSTPRPNDALASRAACPRAIALATPRSRWPRAPRYPLVTERNAAVR